MLSRGPPLTGGLAENRTQSKVTGQMWGKMQGGDRFPLRPKTRKEARRAVGTRVSTLQQTNSPAWSPQPKKGLEFRTVLLALNGLPLLLVCSGP